MRESAALDLHTRRVVLLVVCRPQSRMVERAEAQLNLNEGDFSGIEQNIQAPLHVDESRPRLCAMQFNTHNTAS